MSIVTIDLTLEEALIHSNIDEYRRQIKVIEGKLDYLEKERVALKEKLKKAEKRKAYDTAPIDLRSPEKKRVVQHSSRVCFYCDNMPCLLSRDRCTPTAQTIMNGFL